MIEKDKLGTYTNTEEKFWRVEHVNDDLYQVSYGYLGQPSIGMHIIIEAYALKKIQQKIIKGYSYSYQNSINMHEKLESGLESKPANKKIKL